MFNNSSLYIPEEIFSDAEELLLKSEIDTSKK